MSKPFDATIKHLLDKYPGDWMRGLGLGEVEVRAIDADLSAVSAQADKVFLTQTERPWIIHLEMQASRDPRLAERILKYHALLTDRHRLPVHSVCLLLRPEADGAEMTGRLEFGAPPGLRSHFQFQMIRLWTLDYEKILDAGPGTAPLAPIANVAPLQIANVIDEMKRRFSRVEKVEVPDLWLATYIMLGLRHSADEIDTFFKGVGSMIESSTYQAIVRRGMAEGIAAGKAEGIAEGIAEGKSAGRAVEAREMILMLGEIKFGAPQKGVRAALEGIEDVHQLEMISTRLFSAANWSELLRPEATA